MKHYDLDQPPKPKRKFFAVNHGRERIPGEFIEPREPEEKTLAQVACQHIAPLLFGAVALAVWLGIGIACGQTLPPTRNHAPAPRSQARPPFQPRQVITPTGFLTAAHGLGKTHAARGTNILCGVSSKSPWVSTNGPATCIRCRALTGQPVERSRQ